MNSLVNIFPVAFDCTQTELFHCYFDVMFTGNYCKAANIQKFTSYFDVTEISIWFTIYIVKENTPSTSRSSQSDFFPVPLCLFYLFRWQNTNAQCNTLFFFVVWIYFLWIFVFCLFCTDFDLPNIAASKRINRVQYLHNCWTKIWYLYKFSQPKPRNCDFGFGSKNIAHRPIWITIVWISY